MACLMHYDDWRGGYLDLVDRVVNQGAVKDSRIGRVMEIRDFVFTLAPESIDLPLGVGRKISTPLAAAEAIQLCSGVGMPDLTEAAAKQVASFVRDPDGTVHGNYGGRVGLQIVDVVDKLRANSSDRQAVIQIWDRALDSRYRQPMPRDIPCTLSIVFGLTPASTLTMSVMMRSSDVWLGMPFDVFQFRQLQRTVQNVLQASSGHPVGLGTYTHHSVSMHAYDHDLGKIRGLHYEGDWSLAGPMPDGLHSQHAAALPSTMIGILRGEDLDHPSHEWYHARLGAVYASTLG